MIDLLPWPSSSISPSINRYSDIRNSFSCCSFHFTRDPSIAAYWAILYNVSLSLQPSQHPDMFHARAALLERRAATAGEKVPQSTVSESFYSFFPSFNEDKQQKLEVRRQEYFEYLKQVRVTGKCKETGIIIQIMLFQIKTSSPTMTTTPRCELPTLDGSLDEQRRMEKDRLAAQFQKSKQKSILNYQIVEARNQRAEEVGVYEFIAKWAYN